MLGYHWVGREGAPSPSECRLLPGQFSEELPCEINREMASLFPLSVECGISKLPKLLGSNTTFLEAGVPGIHVQYPLETEIRCFGAAWSLSHRCQKH